MSPALDFEDFQDLDVRLQDIRREFDVRTNATVTNLAAVTEMRVLGLENRRPPYFTADNVILDGRHYTDGKELQTDKPLAIRGRVLSFNWDDLTVAQKAEVVAWSLKLNMPGADGYREFAKTDDVTFTIKKEFLEKGLTSKEDVRKYLSYVPLSQFKPAWEAAWTSYKQATLYRAQKESVIKNLSPREMAATLPKELRGDYLKKAGGGANPPSTPHTGAKAIRDRQAAMTAAVNAVARYTSFLLEHLGEPGYSPSIVEAVLKHHRDTYALLGKRLERGAAVVEKAIVAKRAELNRF